MILYGAGGHAKVVIDCITSQEKELLGFFEDKSDLVSLNGYDVFGVYDANHLPEEEIIVTIGDNAIRKRISGTVIKHPFGKAIHTSAIISPYVKIGVGSVVVHGSIIQTGAKIGKHCIINTKSSIDHDSIIEDFCHISPGVTICAAVKVHEGTHIGAGATILPNVNIGKWCVIGAGAVITQNLPDYSLVVGVPGKVIRKLES